MQAVLLGKKVGMTQVYDEAGLLHPVTVVQAGPCRVMQVKTAERDGYDAVQIGFEEVPPRRAGKPATGHAAAAGVKPVRTCREVRLSGAGEAVEAGSELTVVCFEGIDWVDVIGTTKGKGFAGTMKRHNFKGQQASHGVERKHRSPGSIASHGADLGHSGDIKKGKKMPGQMGNARCTSRHHKLIAVDEANGLLLIKGPVPGAAGGLVVVRESKTKAVPKGKE